jgi:hypothetical protein
MGDQDDHNEVVKQFQRADDSPPGLFAVGPRGLPQLAAQPNPVLMVRCHGGRAQALADELFGYGPQPGGVGRIQGVRRHAGQRSGALGDQGCGCAVFEVAAGDALDGG